MSKEFNRNFQVEFQARFAAKKARRDANKAAKEDPILKKQIQDLLIKGDTNGAYQKAKMLLIRQQLAAQMSQMANMAELSALQIQATNSMSQMTKMVESSSKIMTMAQKTSNPEKTLVALEQHRQQTEEYAMSNGIVQDAISGTASTQVGEDAVHELLGKLADDAGIKLAAEMSAATPTTPVVAEEPQTTEPTAEEEDALQQRLRALRA